MSTSLDELDELLDAARALAHDREASPKFEATEAPGAGEVTEVNSPPIELRWRLAYAAHGFRQFPLYPIVNGHCGCPKGAACTTKAGKHPRIKKWNKLATTDETTIRAWHEKWPNAGIGLVTGNESGLIIVDRDGAAGGALRAEFEGQHGALPKTAVAETGRVDGGDHSYFTCSKDDPPLKSIKPGTLDFLAEDSFVCAPPTMHASGKKYEFQTDVAFAALTPEVAATLRAFIAEKSGEGRSEKAVDTELSAASRKLLEGRPDLKRLSPRFNKRSAGIHEATGNASTPDPYTEENVERLRSALARVAEKTPERISKRKSWIGIGMGLHELTDHGWPETVVRGLWDEVSIGAGFTGMGPAGNSPDGVDCEAERDKDWNSFGRGGTGRKITVATIFRWARDLKWQDPRKRAPVAHINGGAAPGTPTALEHAGKAPGEPASGKVEGGVAEDPTAAAVAYTEAWNARRLVIRDGENSRYIPGGKDSKSGHWMLWDGEHWRNDIDGMIIERAKQMVHAMHLEALGIEFKDEKKDLLDWAMTSSSRRAVKILVAPMASMRSCRR